MMASSKLKTAAEVSRELMDSALYAVEKSGVSKKLAAKLFGVSRTTLGRRLQNPRPERHGGRTKFPAQVEDELVDLLTSCCIMGIPLNRYHCYQLFSQVAIELGLKNTACSSTSFKNFLKRHKSLSLRISHASNRKQDREWTMEVCEQYISKLQKLKDGGFLDAPEQIWNLDETAFDTSQVVDTVVGVKGLKLVPSQFNGNAKECVTVLPCGNAAGLQLKFLALYSGKLHIQSRLQDTHNMCYHAVNVSGYMDQLIFANYVKTVVFPAMTAEKNVIFVDGHFSHVNNLLLVRYCRDHFKETGVEVQIFCFPSGQTSRLQPFDVSAFGPMKKKWNEHLRNRRIKKGIVTKDTFLSHLVMLWFKTEGCPEQFAFDVGPTLQSGFARCGLYPFSPVTIRATVKPFNDPTVLESGIRTIEPDQNHDELFELLARRYHITSSDHHAEVKEFVEKVQRGVTPASALARALAKSLMDDAPRKKRLQKNTMLNLKAGALITSDEFVETVEKMQADSAAKKAALKAADAATKAASKAAGKVTASAAEKAARKAEKAAEKVAEKTAKAAEKAATQAAKAVEKAAAKLAARDAKLSRIQKRKTVDDIPPPKRARKETCKA